MTEAPTLNEAIRSQVVQRLRTENGKLRKRAQTAERQRDELTAERDALLKALARADRDAT